MQILRLLAARRAAASIADASPAYDDEGPFFDLDFSSCSVRASSSSSSGGSLSLSDSDDDDDDDRTDLDFIISMHRTRSASPLHFCASEPPARPNSLHHHSQQQHCARKRGLSTLRSLSFGPRRPAPLYGGGRHSFARSSSSGRRSFARSSTSSARSLRLFVNTPAHATDQDEHQAAQRTGRRAPSRDAIRRCLSSISRRLRTAASPRAAAGAEGRGLRRLRKCRSASSVPPGPSSVASRCDDSAAEKQDGIAGAIAHCKDSLHRASTSDSTSDPGEREAA